MLEIRISVEVGTPPDKVWDIVGDFDGLPHWHPWVQSSALEAAPGGVGRRVVNVGGNAGRRELVERLVYFDASKREYAYMIVGGTAPPFVDYVGHFRVVARGKSRSVVEYHARFSAAPGRTDAEARERIRTFYESGLANLTRLFGA
jgi:carbon monoxide dehydrogenase subunit G